MKYKGLELKVPRRLVSDFIDLLAMHGIETQRATKDSQPKDYPVLVLVKLPPDILFDMEDTTCEFCGEKDGKHEPPCDGTCPDCGEPHDDEDPLDTERKHSKKKDPPKAN